MKPAYKVVCAMLAAGTIVFIGWLCWAIIYGMLYGFHTPVKPWVNEAWAWIVGLIFLDFVLAAVIAAITAIRGA
jgi:hypothetical protein